MSAILPGYSTSVDATDEVCVTDLIVGAGAGILCTERLMML